MAVRGRHSADEKLAAELAAGRTVRDAAVACGVSERTAFRRLDNPIFRARVNALRSEMVEKATGLLAEGMTEAVGVLKKLLTNRDPNVRRHAAVKVIELGAKLTENIHLQQRVAELEQWRDVVETPNRKTGAGHGQRSRSNRTPANDRLE